MGEPAAEQSTSTAAAMGAPTREPTSGAQSGEAEEVVQADSITLENEYLKLSFLAWQYHPGFRITMAELKDFTRKKEATSTERIPVNLLEESGFEVLGRKDTSLEVLKLGDRSDTSVTFIWIDTLGEEKRITVILTGRELALIRSDSLAALLFHCPAGLLPTEPGDKTELTMYQLYYRDGQNKINYLNTKRIDQVKKGKREIESGPYEWVALRSKYFTAIILPSEPVVGKIIPSVTKKQRIGLSFDIESGREFTLYFGPQDYDTLAKMGHKLSRIVELGGSAFRWLGVIMLKIFQFFYRIIGNYGIAIIVFSILIKLVFLPLSQVQQRSMQKMQMLQPKLKELQERFKDDKQRLNEETMKLYKLHGASPFKGCLPMLVQLPVFFGLYAVLRNAINLRGAPFVKLFPITVSKPINLISKDFLNLIRIPAGEIWWLVDLSQHDPFYILPILMGVASVFQSLLTNPNPQQRLMTFMMPIFITVIFLNFPSGLQLYWFLFNLLSILEFAIFRRGMKAGGDQWQSKRLKEIASARSLPKSSRR
ncbi:MAG: YidC/Oxa1 family insertase periplasmic-domain containing protein [candidate division WOR-3 bacterium]|nr:YidC/Oxa1 family insertase periplasmic-domain containing protein [candidate division WOR-3 bacterium]